MLPYKTLVKINRENSRPIYLQVSDIIIKNIRKGIIPPNTKLPSSREMAITLGLNRQTIVTIYEELEVQGWIKTIPYKGSFVLNDLPIVIPKPISKEKQTLSLSKKTNQGFVNDNLIYINRGQPDERLAPLETLGKAYKTALKLSLKNRSLNKPGYANNTQTTEIITSYLNRSRGLQVDHGKIMFTQGSKMGIYIIGQLLLKKGDITIVGETNYVGANNIFKNQGAIIKTVSVDDHGINIDEVEIICKKHNIKCLFVTPHHHLPTTVTLSSARRMQLLALAEKYNFYIIEDDYDYDYHYLKSPILPLASIDTNGHVIYVGSMSKIFTHGIRFGYVIAQENVINKLTEIRKNIDHSGDVILTKAMSIMIQDGDIERQLKKTLKVYHKRRDYFCSILERDFSGIIEFDKPKGGLAIWVLFNKKYPLDQISKACLKKDLVFPDGLIYNPKGKLLNGTRMGFAPLNKDETDKALGILKEVIEGFDEG